MRYLAKKRSRSMGIRRSKKVPTLIFDKQEKKPWKPKFFKATREHLPTGDYTFTGFEKIISIERKDSLKELLTNLSGRDRKRFYNEIDRLTEFPVRCIIVEDDLRNLKKALREMKQHMPNMKMSEETIYCWLCRMIFEYNIPVLFVGKLFRRNRQALDIFLSYMLEIARKL